MRRLRPSAAGLPLAATLRWLGLGLVLYLSLWPARPMAAQGDTAVVRPEPPILNIGQGQVETVHIILENAHDVYGIDVRASFDPAVVEVVDADPARDGIQLIPGTFVQPDFLVRNVADNQAGTLMYVTTQVNPTPPANGTGVVFSVQFRGKVLGKQSELKIDSVAIADRRGVKLSVQPQSGVLAVVQPKPPTATPVRTATTAPVSPTVPRAAATRVAATGTSVPANAGAPSGPAAPVSDTWLILIAGAGLLGTVILLTVALLVLRRRTDSPANGRSRS